ncbi:MAG: LPS export ABC transporter periplasmic protein LptC [Thiobacillus sp.]
MGRTSLWLPLVLLLFLAGVSAWLNYTVHGPQSKQKRESDPETIVENFEAIRTDTAGRLKERLSATRLTHYSGSKLSLLEAPHLTQISPDAADLTAIAERATISRDNEEVSMENNVRVTRAATPQNAALQLTTQRLLVYPKRELLRAPGPVNVLGPGLNLRAGRMEVQSKQRIIKFSGRVKALYQNAKS